MYVLWYFIGFLFFFFFFQNLFPAGCDMFFADHLVYSLWISSLLVGQFSCYQVSKSKIRINIPLHKKLLKLLPRWYFWNPEAMKWKTISSHHILLQPHQIYCSFSGENQVKRDFFLTRLDNRTSFPSSWLITNNYFQAPHHRHICHAFRHVNNW